MFAYPFLLLKSIEALRLCAGRMAHLLTYSMEQSPS